MKKSDISKSTQIGIGVGSVVSLTGWNSPTVSSLYAYPVMTVKRVIQCDDNRMLCVCLWFVNGIEVESTYSRDILMPLEVK